MKRVTARLGLFVLFTAALAGCSPPQNPIVGKWQSAAQPARTVEFWPLHVPRRLAYYSCAGSRRPVFIPENHQMGQRYAGSHRHRCPTRKAQNGKTAPH